jgi:hypothetical protein
MNGVELTKVTPQMPQTRDTFTDSMVGRLQIFTPEGGIYLDQDINFGAMGVAEVFQNVKYILLTEYFSVPLDREFGMNFTMVDKPIPVAEAMLSQEVAMKVALYEPRCLFKQIEYSGEGIAGKLNPNVMIAVTATEFLPSLYPSGVTPSSGEVTKVAYTYTANIPDFIDVLVAIAGLPGPPGPQGEPGKAASIAAGVTITGLPGTPALVVNVGTSNAAVFDFTIPEGLKGDAGSYWFVGDIDPIDPFPGARVGDLYLNQITGDIFRFN